MSGTKLVVNLAVGTFAALWAANFPLIYFCWIEPNRLIQRSKSWVRVPCTVISTDKPHEDGGYRHVFEYQFQGRTYRSSRSTFWGDANFRYIDGSRVQGLVNPARPKEAVLRPDHWPHGIEYFLIFWLFISTWGFGSYLAVRFNLRRIQATVGSPLKLYYREM